MNRLSPALSTESTLSSLSAEDVAVRPLEAPAAGHIIGVSLLALGIAYQEQVDVIGLKRRDEWRLEVLVRAHRPHELPRDNDDKIRLVLLEVGGAKKRAKDRQVADPGQLVDGVGRLRLEQTGDGETLSVPQFDGGVGLALGQGWDRGAIDVEAVAVLTSVTDGLSCRLIMPLLSTVGVKSRPTPYCFHSIETFGV